MLHSKRLLILIFAMAVGPVAWSAGKKGVSEAQQTYQRERAHCMSGKSNQDRATCLREASAALQEARRNKLDSGAGASLQANAVARCQAQPVADQDACVQRVTGSGSTRGSVEGGGLIREVVTPVK